MMIEPDMFLVVLTMAPAGVGVVVALGVYVKERIEEIRGDHLNDDYEAALLDNAEWDRQH